MAPTARSYVVEACHNLGVFQNYFFAIDRKTQSVEWCHLSPLLLCEAGAPRAVPSIYPCPSTNSLAPPCRATDGKSNDTAVHKRDYSRSCGTLCSKNIPLLLLPFTLKKIFSPQPVYTFSNMNKTSSRPRRRVPSTSSMIKNGEEYGKYCSCPSSVPIHEEQGLPIRAQHSNRLLYCS